MSDKKISQLTASTTPLAGTEVLPIVQGGVTKQVSVDNLTAGKTVPALALNVVTGNTGTTIRSTPGLIIRSNGTNTDTNLRFSDTDSFASEIGQQNGEMYFTTAGTEKLRIVSGGNFKINVGNLVIGTAGKGIDFSATPGTGTSELLADYEEGTWTPVLVGSTSAGVGTYSQQVGTYTKIGNRVNITMFLSWTNHTGTGDASITGLPFTCANLNTFSIRPNLYALSLTNIMTGFINSSGTSLVLEQYPSGGGAVVAAPIDISATLIISAQYGV